MMYSNFLVMSFPFITQIEYDEKMKREKALKSSNNLTNVNNIHANRAAKKKHEQCEKDSCNKTHCDKSHNLTLLSNLEEIAFLSSPSRCSRCELFPASKEKKIINYDKYLDFFE